MAARVTLSLCACIALFASKLDVAEASLSHSRAQNRQLQRAIHHDRLVVVLEGVRQRALNSVKPDPILLINYPEIDYQFKVRKANL